MEDNKTHVRYADDLIIKIQNFLDDELNLHTTPIMYDADEHFKNVTIHIKAYTKQGDPVKFKLNLKNIPLEENFETNEKKDNLLKKFFNG